MGSPLAPVLANFFMGHYEKLWLNNYTGPKVLYYRRYVSLSMGTYERRFRRAFFIKSSIFQRNRRFSQSRIRTFLEPFPTFFLSSTLISTFSGLIVDQMIYNFHI